MNERTEDAILAILKGLVLAVPAFGSWFAALLSGAPDQRPAFTARVREILPPKSASRSAAERLRGK